MINDFISVQNHTESSDNIYQTFKVSYYRKKDYSLVWNFVKIQKPEARKYCGWKRGSNRTKLRKPPFTGRTRKVARLERNNSANFIPLKGERPLGEHTGWRIFFSSPSRSSGLISARKTWSGKVSSRRKTGGKYDDAGRKEGRKEGRREEGRNRRCSERQEVSFERSPLRQSRPEVIRELARDFFIIAPLMNLKIFHAARSRSSIGEKTVGKLIRGRGEGWNVVSFQRPRLLNRQRA